MVVIERVSSFTRYSEIMMKSKVEQNLLKKNRSCYGITYSKVIFNLSVTCLC